MTNDNIFIQVWGDKSEENTRFTIQLLQDNNIPFAFVNCEKIASEQLRCMVGWDNIPVVQVFKYNHLWRTWYGFQPQAIDEYILNV